MDDSDEEFDDQESLDLYDQDGPDLFGSAEPAVEAVPVEDLPVDEPAVEVGPHRRSEEELTASLMEAVDALRQPSVDISRPETPLALYRRYRPDTFADVIGQEHVTEPLQRALTNNRVNHAYLFSGPRGCGKTTSARILARCLNCAEGPTPEPCGVCQSCRDLARGGAGSIDVIEIDAASHGGVNEARDLRERAFFSPMHSRYKIYIIDEAHMVTKEGFNALLKVVEEPPPHVKFIFATTEPEKVLGTIRSRTHHYPFRLVPPKTLSAYLATLCRAEGIAVEPAVLPLVVRAGAGSVRDSLSVLDQLLGGAGPDGVSYAQATGLLGYTPDTLLDEIVDAFAAGDAQGVFAAVDKVIEVGQDPRRFAEDLLRRLRDLIIVAAVPEALTSGLVDVAGDQAERLNAQANALGAGELTRAAEVIAVGLVEMRGTTAPRLHLELMCARVLLPGADAGERGLHARLDRLERRLNIATAGEPAPERPRIAAPATAEPVSAAARPAPISAPDQAAQVSAPDRAEPATSSGRATPTAPTPAHDPWAAPSLAANSAPAAAPSPAVSRDDVLPDDPAGDDSAGSDLAAPSPADEPADAPSDPAPTSETLETPQPTEPSPTPPPTRPQPTAQPGPAPVPPSAADGDAGRPAGDPSQLGTAELRRVWPQILDNVMSRRRYSWILLSQNAQVVEAREGVLTLGFANPGARDSFGRGGSVEVLREAIVEVLGSTLHIQTILDDAEVPSPVASPGPAIPPTPVSPRSPSPSTAADAARANIRATRNGPAEVEAGPEVEPDRDDEVVDEGSASSEELLMKHLGAELLDDET